VRAVLGAARAAADARRAFAGGVVVTPTLDLRREAQKDPLVLPGLDEVTAEERAAALANWRLRMVSEHVSARVFASLVPKLMAAGVARRHAKACSATSSA
jgi:hypothetical protein